MVICDSVITDEVTHKKSLIGIFNSLFAKEFPVHHPMLSIYVTVTDGRGKMPCLLRMIYLEDDKELFCLKGQIEMTDPMATAELVYTVTRVLFEKPGSYAIEFLIDNVLIGTKTIKVTSNQNNV